MSVQRILATGVAVIFFLLLAIPTVSADPEPFELYSEFLNTSDTSQLVQGQSGTFMLWITNNSMNDTHGEVEVEFKLDSQFTIIWVEGDSHWTCEVATASCTADVVRTAGQSYDWIYVTVDVASNAVSGKKDAIKADITMKGLNRTVTLSNAPVVHPSAAQVTVHTLPVQYYDLTELSATISPSSVGGFLSFAVDGEFLGRFMVESGEGHGSVNYHAVLDPGTYTVEVGFVPFAAAIDPTTAFGQLEVTKIPLTVTVERSTREYGEKNGGFTVAYDEDAFPGDTRDHLDDDTLTFTTLADQSSNVGEYEVHAQGLGSPYHEFRYTPGYLEVTQAPLKMTADDQSRTYGDANPLLTGTVIGDVKNNDDITYIYETEATVASPVGLYPIVPSAEGPNIDNYAVNNNNGTLSIEQRELTVTIKNESRQVGAQNPVFTTTSVEGLMEWDDDEERITIILTTDATDKSPAGKYEIDARVEGSAAGNYELQVTKGELTITPRPPVADPAPAPVKVTVTANNATRTYGAENPEFTATVEGLPAGQKLQLSFSTTAAETSGAGTYPITVTATPENQTVSYTVDVRPGTLTVQPAPLSVTPKDATRSQGAENPPLTGTITGIQNGDAITATYATTATSSSAAGTYPITATLADPQGKLANYNVTLRQGALTVWACGNVDLKLTANGRADASVSCNVDADTQSHLLEALTGAPASDASIVEAREAQVQEAITQAAANGAAPRIVLQPDSAAAAQGGLVGSDGLALIAQAGGEVQVNTTFGSMLLPTPLLQQFVGSDLIVLFEDRGPVGQVETGDLSAASSLVEVIVATRSSDGSITPHHSFTMRLTLTLPLTSADPDLAGVYRFETDANGQIIGVTYVGGEVATDGQTVSVERNNLSMYGVLVYDRDYKDVALDHWAYRPIKVMTAKYVAQGVGDNLFHPESAVTRAEFAAMVARAWSLSIPGEPALRFADVAADQWHAATMSAVVQAGLMTPETGNTLRPDGPISRQEMAMVIARAMERFYPQGKLPSVNTDATLAPFGDGAEVAEAARADMARLVTAGLIKGRSTTSLAPAGTTTRAEAATLIWRLLDWGRK